MSEEAKRIIEKINNGELVPLEAIEPNEPKGSGKVRLFERIFKIAAIVCLIAALAFASMARNDAQERAEQQAQTIAEHKANEERLTNELLTVTEQKNELINANFAGEMQKEELQSRFEGLQAEIEDLKTIVKNQSKTIEEQEQIIAGLQEEAPNPYAGIKLTADEEDVFAWVLALEAKHEPEIGRRAVVETACNRVLSDEWNGDTIGAILSATGQYDGYKILQEYRAGKRTSFYAYPDETEKETIRYVLTHGNTALPLDYVYFATYKANGKDFIQIGNHYFGR